MIPRWILKVPTNGNRYRFISSHRDASLSCNQLTNRSLFIQHVSPKYRYHLDVTFRVFSTRERIPSKYNKPKEIVKEKFELSKQGLLYRTSEMDGSIGNVDTNRISCLQVYFDESFAQTLYDITINIKRKLESTFDVMHKPDLITPEEYTDPTTKKLPLYLQPRSFESLNEGICIFYGSTALTPEKIPDDELELFYNKVILRMEESGFVHHDARLSDENTAHPNDFYFSLKMTPHNQQQVQTFPHATHQWLIANIQASVGMYKLYEDLQIAANRIPSLRHDIVHRNNGQLRRSRRPVWIPQIVLGRIVNGMDGCKKEERTLRNLCKNLDVQESFEQLNFIPKGIRMQGYIPKLSHDENRKKAKLDMNWDFTFEHCLNAKRPQLSEWINSDDWVEDDFWRYDLKDDDDNDV
jgi:hypothetical protein